MAEYYRYEKYQKYINGVPANPPEYKQGELIGTGEYDSKADCENDAIYRWVDNGETVCKEYSLYNQEKKQKSTDNGITWTDTGEVRTGNKIVEQYSTQCGWRLMTRWQKTGRTVCDGYNLSEEYVKQESWDMGKTWYNSIPEEYKYEVIDSYNEDCILNSEPITYEVTAESVDLSLEMGLISIAMKIKTSPPYNMGYKEVTYKFWIQWDEEEPIVPYNLTTRISGQDSGSSYTWKYNAASNYRVPAHQYLENKTHTIKVWGIAVFIGTPNVPFKIIKWGTAHGVYFNDPVRVGWGGHPQFDKYEQYYSYHARTINISGDNLLQWAMVENNALSYNDKFVSNNTQMDHLPVTTFQGMQTTYLDVSNNSKLLSIPTLQEGEDNKVPWQRLIAKNCTSLTETPSGIWQNKVYKNSIGEWDYDSYYKFDCTDAFNGCTNLSKINGPIKVEIATRMFVGTAIQDISDVDLVVKNAAGMFKGLSSLTTLPKSLNGYEETDNYLIISKSKYASMDGTTRAGMFYGTGIAEATEYIMLDCTRVSFGCDYSEMFANSQVAKVSGVLPSDIKYESLNYDMMFANSQVSEVSPLFRDVLGLPSVNQMFDNCKLVNLPNDFINNEAEFVDVNKFQLVFANNPLLTNYPIQDNIPIWHWIPFYLNASLIWTMAFQNCPLILEQVPLEWGGIYSTKKPVLLEFEKAGQVDIRIDSNSVILYNGITYRGSQVLDILEDVKNLSIYVISGTWRVYNKDIPYKILDFGDGGSIYSADYQDQITYLGTDQGAFSTSTGIPMNHLKYVKEVSVDFLKSGVNINDLDELFYQNQYLKSIPEGTFSKLNNLSSADRFLYNSNIENVDGLFEGCSKLITAYLAFGDCSRLTSAQRTFKDCTSLESINNIFGTNPGYITTPINCNQLFENTAITSFSPNMSNFAPISSAIGMFRSCSSMTKANCNFILSGDSIDLTEMFKDCSLLTMTEDYRLFSKVNEAATINFTRCFQNCTSLNNLPKMWYNNSYVNLWEIPGVTGDGCFNGCTLLIENFGDQIPANWK